MFGRFIGSELYNPEENLSIYRLKYEGSYSSRPETGLYWRGQSIKHAVDTAAIYFKSQKYLHICTKCESNSRVIKNMKKNKNGVGQHLFPVA
jgi:hypothetical protein